jgi:serine/threonine protein kinase
MASPSKITDLGQLEFAEDTFLDQKHGNPCWIDYTFAFTFDDDDHLELGHLVGPRSNHTPDQLIAALERVPDERIYFQLPAAFAITVAGEPTMGPGLRLKRPLVIQYNWIQDDADEDPKVARDSIANWLRHEVEAMQLIAQHPPHPNIVKYYGCRVRRGFVTGIVMEAIDGVNLSEYIKSGKTIADKERFLAALESAVRYLHGVVGLVHNDFNPNNIMVRREDETPVLIDFGSAHRQGDLIVGPLGTTGWMETMDAWYCISSESHDLWALEKLRGWLDKPEFLPSKPDLSTLGGFVRGMGEPVGTPGASGMDDTQAVAEKN